MERQTLHLHGVLPQAIDVYKRQEQTLPIGALESDIKFPTSLTVTVEKTTQADEKEADDEEDALSLIHI